MVEFESFELEVTLVEQIKEKHSERFEEIFLHLVLLYSRKVGLYKMSSTYGTS